MKALLVDPDPQRAPVLAAALDAGGAEVSVAPSASFALTMLEWNKQDVIISRARLGDMEGHELCAIVRSDPSTKDVRFVLVVGNGEAAPAQAAVAGVDLVLPDALSSATIVTRVVQLVRRQTESTAAAAASTLPAPWAIRVVVLNGSGDIVYTRSVASRIQALSYRVTHVGKATSFNYPQTQVYYPPAGEAIALRLAKQLGVPVQPLPGGLDPRRLVVIVGPKRGPGN